MPAAVSHPRLRRHAVASLLLAVLLGSTALAAAPELRGRPSVLDMAALSLEGLLDLSVTGPSRQAQRMSQAAASVSVITGEELRALGYRSIADALRSLRGLSFAYDRAYTYLGVRGVHAPGDYNTRVLLLVDGNRVNDIVYDQAYVGSEAPLDIDQVERIEFIPGQGGAVYGANALFGVINVVTRSAARSTSGAGLRLGSGRDRELQALWQRGSGDSAWLVSASRRVSPGADPVLPEAEALGFAGGVVPGIDHEQVNRLRVAAQGPQWRTQLLHSDRTKGYGAPVDVLVGDRRSVARDRMTLLDAAWQQPLGTRGDWQARVFTGRYRFVGDYVIAGSPISINRDDDEGRWWGAELRASTRAWAGHALQAGLEWQRATRLTMRNFDLGAEDQPYLDLREHDRRLGLWAEDQVELGGGLSAVLGLRHDRVDGFAGQWSPRVALVWRLGDDWVLKALHGGAFRPPNTFERAYEVGGPGGYERNPALQPERVRGQELVAEWTPRADWRVTLAGFRSQARNLIVLHTLADREFNTYSFDNLPRTTAQGLEAAAQWLGQQGWRARANLSLQRPGDASDDSVGAQAPRRMAKGTLIMPLAGDWTLGLDGQALSRRGAAPGSAVLNVYLSRSFGDGVRLGLGASNLLDRALADPGASPETQPVVLQDRRRWWVQLQLAH